MIVRIHGTGQYRLDEADRAELEAIDAHLANAVERGAGEEAHNALVQAISFVQRHGQRLDDSDLSPSAVILPAADATPEETHDFLRAHGLTV